MSFICSSPISEAPFPSLTSLLKGLTAINGCKEIILIPNENGICMSVDVNKITQVHSYIPSELFSVYRLNGNNHRISLPLDSLYNALKFGIGSKSLFSFNFLENKDNVIISYDSLSDKVECLIKTLVCPEIPVIDFNSSELIFKTILKSEDFSLYFTEILQKKSEWSIQGDPGVKQIILSYNIGQSSTEIVIPIDGDGDILDCRKAFKYSYTSSIITSLLVISNIATKVSIRINGEGLLSIQLMIKVNSRDQKFFVEYMLPSQIDFDLENNYS